MVSLVIGGARSGKSRFAQSLGAAAEHPVYIATARVEDSEMAERIARHQADRPPQWTTVEEPLDIAGAVARHRGAGFILIDCLTLWLSNLCWEGREASEAAIEDAAMRQIECVAKTAPATHVVLVSNEVGCGLVPESAVGRAFRDLQGRVNQTVAQLASQVFLMVAGIPVAVKQPGRRS